MWSNKKAAQFRVYLSPFLIKCTSLSSIQFVNKKQIWTFHISSALVVNRKTKSKCISPRYVIWRCTSSAASSIPTNETIVNFPIKCATLSLLKLQCTTVLWYTAVNRENDGSHPSNISFSFLLTSYRLDFGFVSDGQLPFTGRPSATETNNRRICKKTNSIIFFLIIHSNFNEVQHIYT